MSEVKLVAEPRSEFGKGAARRLRRAKKVPAVLYGHGEAPLHVALDGHATMMALKQSNALLSIDLEGSIRLALPKDVQRDPIRGSIDHVDLLIVKRGEKVTVDVPVQVIGEAAPGTVVIPAVNALSITVEATAIPGSVEVDVTGLEAGSMINAGDVRLPEGATLADDEALLVVNIIGETQEAAAEGEAEESGEESADAAE